MNIAKPLAIVALGVSMALAGGSSAFAKGHDQGVADGTQPFGPGQLRDGIVAQPNDPLIGFDEGGNFHGVAAIGSDLTYGLDVVAGQRENDVRRIKPCGIGNKDACE